ncbi:Winged helix DNA-binding domain-containing protein [Intestinibacter bartlettii DSM 16795]|jgi:DNA-binding MarR family transcriptional regulator|uniref:MarR family winged helix-turn-helix transcriptional regulator n=1 Tax=Intestinibacter bartlettii TaxID=261299 RepID=UPI00016311B9|nr:MarR family transcriptional regulator [Intestinibacter bartlettii]EDQ95734.1 transcriptional regulator, MarR family [Intestinibacter bartlettii DSM 16795]MDU2163472.1 winged helix-turn-helix transcriptional regulator [Intestinibacter bartlettii]UWO80490.1 MarR family transcriptional regulator [Intestinibacter bartlettii]SKA58972.1 Winged helix DNA-binding domain-containing protein [Intestinibacter bartlettii DSM 16795]
MSKHLSKKMLELNEIMKETDDLYRNLAKKFKMSDCMIWILYILREDDRSVTQSDICNMMYMPKQTVNSSLKKMESEGYIELLNINDKRSKQVCLTEKGVDLANNTVDIIISKENNALSKMDKEEQALFINLFKKYKDLLKESFMEI